jgi:hypothetical protein
VASCKPGTPWCPSSGPNYQVAPPATHPNYAKRQPASVHPVGTHLFVPSARKPQIAKGGVAPASPQRTKQFVRVASTPTPQRPKTVAAPPRQSPLAQRVDVVVRSEPAPHGAIAPNANAYQPPAPSREPAVSFAAATGIGRALTMKCLTYAAGGALLAYLVRK